MLYVWIAIAIVVLFLIGRIIRWWNLPKVAEARTKRIKTRQENLTERARIRRESARIRRERWRRQPTTENNNPINRRREWFFRLKRKLRGE